MNPAAPTVVQGRRFANLPLHVKLVAAFFSIALMTALCGAAGLGLVTHIGKIVSIFSDVTSPLIVENISAIIIAGMATLTLGAMLFLSVLFARVITEPLARLKEHVVAIRESGELVTVSDEKLLARADEIGTLSRSFNLMIEQLGETRARLIAESEVAVRIQYERFNAAVNNMPLGFCMVDDDQKLVATNERFGEIYRLPPAMILPGTLLRISLEYRAKNGHFGDDIGPRFVEERLAAARAPEPWHIIRATRDGRTISVLHQPLAGGGSLSTHEDITARRDAEAQIAHMAHHDALTDLPNRVLFREKLVKALQNIDRGKLAVLCIDLDRFKAVNDTLGHPIGDALLRVVADRLQASARPGDIVARLGGDEFCIMQTDAEQPLGATTLATRLITEIAKPFELDGHQVIIGASVGISIAPNDGSEPDKLLRNADTALYRAKRDGRESYRFFEPDMDAKMQVRRAMEIDLRRALTLGQFEVYYQPLITLKTEKISGFEALLRWHHPERGLVSPMEFIPVAEEIGLIGEIGAWVLKCACCEAATWPDDIHIAVNLSPTQFKQRAIVLDVIAALGASGLPARRLELEITETVLLQDTESTIGILGELRNLGVGISMDDFGTGYSSLAYLHKFPFDKIKIDRQFVSDLSGRPESIAIVRAVTGLGVSLGMKTTAEGVETEEQLQTLKAEGCTEVQGYLFSKPVPAAEAALLLKSLKAVKAVA